jgi:hypothetical protein
MNPLSETLDALRRPAYTGRERCLPCTLLNLGVIAACVAALSHKNRRPLAVALAAIGTGAVWLRGYVLPYTPRFAPSIVAALPIPEEVFHAGNTGSTGSTDSVGSAREAPDDPGSLAAVEATSRTGHKTRADDGGVEATGTDGDTVLASLVDAGVLVAENGALSIDSDARDRWEGEIDSLNSLTSAELAAELRERTPTVTETRVVDGDRPAERGRWIALGDGSEIASEAWLSRPIAISEAAAIGALDAFDLPLKTRLAAARPLRMFLETCPDCGGPVEETTTATCCGGLTNPREGPRDVLACAECGERLFTFP